MDDANFVILIGVAGTGTNKLIKSGASGLHETCFSLREWFDFKDSGMTRRDCSGEYNVRRIRFSIEQTAFTAFAGV